MIKNLQSSDKNTFAAVFKQTQRLNDDSGAHNQTIRAWYLVDSAR